MELMYQNEQVTWLDYENPSAQTIIAIHEEFKIDMLVLQDSVELGHLPKYEKMDVWECLLVRFYSTETSFYQNVLREFSKKVAIFFTPTHIITIHQYPIPFVNEIKNTLAKLPHDKVNFKRVIYLLLSWNFKTFEHPYDRMTAQLEKIENQLFLSKNTKFELKSIYQLKREANSCRKILSITRDILDEYLAYHKKQAYIQDVYEMNIKLLHEFNQVVDDTQNLLNMYISISSQRSNETMKLLTIFSAFFLPLTFIVGVYGMNFKFMPELDWAYGYPAVWILMLVIVLIIYFWFKRKRIL